MQFRDHEVRSGWEALHFVVFSHWEGNEGCIALEVEGKTIRIALLPEAIYLVPTPEVPKTITNPLVALAEAFSTDHCRLTMEALPETPGQPIDLWHTVQLSYLRRYSRARLQEAAIRSREATIVIENSFQTPLGEKARKACAIANRVSSGTTVRAVFEGQKVSVREFVDLAALAEMGFLSFSLDGKPFLPFGPSGTSSSDTGSQDGCMLSTETALEQAIAFARRGWFGAARYRFEDFLQAYPEHGEAKAYLAWIDLNGDKHPSQDLIELSLLQMNQGLLSAPRNADLHTYRGMLLRLTNRYSEAIESFEKALQLEPRHQLARSEKKLTSLRLTSDDWPDIEVESVKVAAKIIIQRRIGRNVRVHSFPQDEVRIGSGLNDDIVVSDAVMPQIAKRHCTVLARDGHLFVRRNASRGRVWLNDTELEIRKDTRLGFEDCVRLGEATGGPAFEFRVFNLAFLHELESLQMGSISV